MSQGSFLQDHDLFEIVLQNNKRTKRKFDDGGYEDDLKPTKKQKNKKDFSKQREQKRGEFQ
jgi:hypothetical protein